MEGLDYNKTTDQIRTDQFDMWYKMDDQKKLRAELKGKRVFAQLLEETLHRDEVVKISTGQINKMVSGKKVVIFFICMLFQKSFHHIIY